MLQTGLTSFERIAERGLDVVRMLVSQSMKPVLWGLALGLGGAVLVARWLESLLYNVTASEAPFSVLRSVRWPAIPSMRSPFRLGRESRGLS